MSSKVIGRDICTCLSQGKCSCKSSILILPLGFIAFSSIPPVTQNNLKLVLHCVLSTFFKTLNVLY